MSYYIQYVYSTMKNIPYTFLLRSLEFVICGNVLFKINTFEVSRYTLFSERQNTFVGVYVFLLFEKVA